MKIRITFNYFKCLSCKKMCLKLSFLKTLKQFFLNLFKIKVINIFQIVELAQIVQISA